MVKAKMDHILIVDDDVELCGLVQEYLASEGFTSRAVNDGEQGLQQGLSGEFALVVLDVMLPGINGFEVLRRLRSVSRIRSIRASSPRAFAPFCAARSRLGWPTACRNCWRSGMSNSIPLPVLSSVPASLWI